MTSYHLAWRTADPGSELVAISNGQVLMPSFESPGGNTNFIVVHPTVRRNPETYAEAVRDGLSMPAVLNLLLVPAEQQLIVFTLEATAHFLRLADATLKPLEPEPAPIQLAPGDAYVAVIPGRAPLTPEARLAAARFIHLRDYFNADKLAVELLKHLLADDEAVGPLPPALGVLVIECR